VSIPHNTRREEREYFGRTHCPTHGNIRNSLQPVKRSIRSVALASVDSERPATIFDVVIDGLDTRTSFAD
jgi:hypothetical protein